MTFCLIVQIFSSLYIKSDFLCLQCFSNVWMDNISPGALLAVPVDYARSLVFVNLFKFSLSAKDVKLSLLVV